MVEKGKPGRKTKYTKDMAERAYKLTLLGLTDVELALAFGVAPQTIENWKNRFPSFREALRKGKIEADANVAVSLYRKACGYSHPDVDIRVVDGRIVKTEIIKHYPPDTGAACFWLKNRTKRNREPWLEIARTELTGKDGGPIRTQNWNVQDQLDLSDLTDEELKMLERIGLKALQQQQDE